MENMKIKVINAPAFMCQLEILRALSGCEATYPFDLWEKLVKLERKASRMTLRACNEDVELNFDPIKKKVQELLPNLDPSDFFINYDPRGYALKIREDKAKELGIWTDWGRYGIIAPEL